MAKKRKRSKPGKGKFRNVRKYYVLISAKTGRQVSKARAKRYRIKVRKAVRYRSTITGRNISPQKIQADSRLQALSELHENPLSKKQKAHWRSVLNPTATMSELRAQATNYQRWYLAIYKENPDLLTPKLAKVAQEYQQQLEIGGSDE